MAEGIVAVIEKQRAVYYAVRMPDLREIKRGNYINAVSNR